MLDIRKLKSNKLIDDLHEKYYNVLYAMYYDFGKAAGLNSIDVEDAIGDVFLKLLEMPSDKILAIIELDKPLAYLAKILRNKLIDIIRKNRRAVEGIAKKMAGVCNIRLDTFSDIEYNEILEVLKNELSNIDYEIIFGIFQKTLKIVDN